MSDEAKPLLIDVDAGEQQQVEEPSLSVETIFDACSVVGAWRDLLLRDVRTAMEHFSPEVPQGLPIRRLLSPPPVVPTKPVSVAAHGGAGCCSGPQQGFKVGDHVWARAEGPEPEADGTTRAYNGDEMKRTRWYRAVIVGDANESGDYSIKWDYEFDKDTIKSAENLAPAGGQDSLPGSDHMLATSHRARGWKMRALSSFMVGILALVALQVWSKLLSKSPCQLNPKVGCACVVICMSTYFIIMPALFKLIKIAAPSTAMQARRKLFTICVDPILLRSLPNTFGICETMALIMGIALAQTFAVFTIVTADAGTVAIGNLAVPLLFKAIEVVAGESLGDQVLMRRQIFERAEVLRRAIHASMTADELRYQLGNFLDLPVTAESVEVSLPLLTLLRSGIVGIEPDSVRLRHFIVPDGQAETSDHPWGQDEPRVKRRHDVIVDVFTGTCNTPGMDQACSKWCLNECRFPWHLGLKADYICSTLEPAMRKLGLAEGMASYRADGAGSWAGGEAPHVAELRERCAQAGSTVQELSQDLHSLVEVDRTMSEPAKVVQATALLRLGAQVNYAPLVLNGWGPLHSALDQSMAELGKCLIEHKADLQQLYRSDGVDYTPFQYCKKQTWLTITSFCAHRLVDEDEELRKRLGLAAPPASSLAPGSVVEVLAGDGRGELVMILDEPVPGMHRIAARFPWVPVKRAADLHLCTDLGEVEAFMARGGDGFFTYLTV